MDKAYFVLVNVLWESQVVVCNPETPLYRTGLGRGVVWKRSCLRVLAGKCEFPSGQRREGGRKEGSSEEGSLELLAG